MTELAAGQVLTASTLNMKLRKRIARARRTTNSTSSGTTTEVGVLRIDDVPILAGHNYRIGYMCHMDVLTVTDTMRGLLRFTTDGSTPTTASGALAGSGSEGMVASNSTVETIFVETDYTPVADEILSLLLTIRHVVGVGAIILQADASVFHTQIYVDDVGDDPGDTGVDI